MDVLVRWVGEPPHTHVTVVERSLPALAGRREGRRADRRTGGRAGGLAGSREAGRERRRDVERTRKSEKARASYIRKVLKQFQIKKITLL